MIGRYKVHCRSVSYDEENGMIVIVGFFEELGESRVIYFPRSDFHHKQPGQEVPHHEMHKTAEMLKNAHLDLTIESDPNRSREAEENPGPLAKEFVDHIEQQLAEVTKGLTDSDQILVRRLGEVVERDHRRRFGDLLADELVMRAQLKGIG